MNRQHLTSRGTQTMKTIQTCIAAFLLPLVGLSAAEPSLGSIPTLLNGGVLVHVGAEDGSLAIAAAQAGPVVVLALAADAKVDALRENVQRAGTLRSRQNRLDQAGARRLR